MTKPQNKEETNDHASVNREGGGEEPPEPPSPSFIECSIFYSSFHHSKSIKVHKSPFFKLDVKFDLLVFSGEYNAENIDNWIKQVEIYFCIQQIKEYEDKVQLASLRLSGTALVWWENKLQKGGTSNRKLLSS